MKDREFDDDEIDYLRSLPAVNSVGRNRIRYTGQFREYCMQRYRAGDSPTGIFRDVGLDPSLIGYKRIERCIARWKMMESADDDAEPISADKFPRTGNPLIPPAPIRTATIRENFGGSEGQGPARYAHSAADPVHPRADRGERQAPRTQPETRIRTAGG